jgi:uncharacterized protein YjbI with pentapeptide repeats
MSEQDGTQASTKRRRSRPASKQSRAALQHPATDDKEAWKAYWKALGQPWRTEPEIDVERQAYLAERRSIEPDIIQGIYPFKEIKLNRADIEWLLETHENGRGPVDWSDENQRDREGLDLRGANLRQLDLSRLPLARIQGGLEGEWWNAITDEQLALAAIHMERTDLRAIHMEGAKLSGAHLEDADLRASHLENANLIRARLQRVRFHFANLRNAHLLAAHLENANLYNVKLENAFLNEVYLTDAILAEVYLEGAKLDEVILSNERHIGPWLVDVHWDNVNLAVVEWSHIKMLGDEDVARQKEHDGKKKGNAKRLDEYKRAVRANRQLAVALQAQGLNEVAARFAYRAQKLQRVVFRRQRKYGQYLFSGFLDLLAGYGYRPGRSVFWYFAMIFGFALAYVAFGHLPILPDALVFSLTSFHGRGFFPGLGNESSLHNPVVVLAACEAVVGLLIEISFIATFTQRFFGK